MTSLPHLALPLPISRSAGWALAALLTLGCGDDGNSGDGSGTSGSTAATDATSATGSGSSGSSGTSAGTGSASGGSSSGGTDSAGTGGTTSGGGATCDESQVLCDGPTPDCPGSTVPEVADGCYTGACIEITTCPGFGPYGDCESCAAGTECVTWSECVGDSCTPFARSCNEPPPDCQGTMTCECAGPAVCGAIGGFSCYDRPNGGIFCCEGDSGTCASAGG